jgi:hypothetical protein
MRACIVPIAILVLTIPAYAKYSGGSGTVEEPYQIATAEDLITLGEIPEDYDKHFILTTDIDLDPTFPGRRVFDRAVIAPDTNDTENHFQGTPFTGVFNGNGHTISHLTIEGSEFVGLFGQTGFGARISNLGLEAVDVVGTGECVGGLVGENGSRIASSYSAGSVKTAGGWAKVGGLAGENRGRITMSYSTGSVSGSYVGGLVGTNTYTGCITLSYSTSSVTGSGSRNWDIGGLVGYNVGSITVSYSAGTVSGTFRESDDVGGLVGRNQGSITSTFWDVQTSGRTDMCGSVVGDSASCDDSFGLTTAQMQDINTYLSEGWDFVDEVLNGTCDYWQIPPHDYPRLYYHLNNGPVMPEGSGTAEQPYLIRDVRDLGTVWFKPLAHYRMEASVDLSGITWCMAVIPWFDGTFEGNRHVISNLHIQGGGSLGLFGWSGGTISNLGLEAVDINGTGGNIGGLVGENDGLITSSYSTGSINSVGSVSNWDGVGGLVGGNNGFVTMSYSTCSVSGISGVGGLAGSHGYGGGNLIKSCYSTGSVSGTSCVGGLVGSLDAAIVSSYSAGPVIGDHQVGGLVGYRDGDGSVTSSCWDMETSGQTVSSDGFGLTTLEMMDPQILGLNGLLVNDPNWVVDAGRDYPRLAWEGTPGQVIPEPVIDWLAGQGTEQEPYRIETADQLILMGRASILWDKHFILGADIDLDPNLPGRKIFNRAVIGWHWYPTFAGVFDGNNHIISHLTISGDSDLGLFGELGPGAIISNLALEEVDINGTGNNVGGLAGANEGSITNCYITGSVRGDDNVGGLVGYNYLGTITTSYSTSSVSGDRDIGGLVGDNAGIVTSSVWDVETSGLTVSDGGIGLTTAEMMDPYTLGLNGFANDPNWVLDAGRDYPRLAREGTAGQIIPEPVIDWLDGQGTDQEPYRIDTADQLILLRRVGLWDKHFVLGADIDLDPNLPGRQIFSEAVIQGFLGVFDGNGHTISHLTISGDSYLGLFGQLGPGAIISNLALEAVNVKGIGDNVYETGNYVGGLVGHNKDGSITSSYITGSVNGNRYVGGLVGRNDGSINTSFSIGTVTGDRYVGGLVGWNYGGGINTSFSMGTVTGDRYVGGLVGWNYGGGITNSYSSGEVTGNDCVGGLVGRNDDIITTSYSTGTVNNDSWSVGGLVGVNLGDITSSFWDIETSNQTTSDGGTGLTTVEMQTTSTFLDAGWDFVNETANGPNDIWTICEGRGYPRLWWETLYVDDDAPDDPGPGDPQIGDPLEDGRQTHPFDTIQEAIDFAPDYLTILVHGGIYDEPIDFKGKAITVMSGPEIAVLEAPGDYAVSFYGGEGPDSILQNFVIRNSLAGIFVPGSSPTIRNLTVVDNEYGITAYTWAQPDISNCIFWNNSEADLFQCEARYSCIEDGDPGEGNLSADPLFIDADDGDYHLLSAGWCWSTKTESWTYDYVTSPCIDAGDPDSPLGDELLRVPRDPDNEYGVNLRINMGAYGGTAQASMAPPGWLDTLE